jgi:hypothetical protein
MRFIVPIITAFGKTLVIIHPSRSDKHARKHERGNCSYRRYFASSGFEISHTIMGYNSNTSVRFDELDWFRRVSLRHALDRGTANSVQSISNCTSSSGWHRFDDLAKPRMPDILSCRVETVHRLPRNIVRVTQTIGRRRAVCAVVAPVVNDRKTCSSMDARFCFPMRGSDSSPTQTPSVSRAATPVESEPRQSSERKRPLCVERD